MKGKFKKDDTKSTKASPAKLDNLIFASITISDLGFVAANTVK